MRQLPLDVQLADYAVFESFYLGSNAAAVHALGLAAGGEGSPVVWLWGPRGSGKSHLLQACVSDASQRQRNTAYLPLKLAHGLGPSMLDGMGQVDVLCIDDAGIVAGEPDWERQLFGVFENLTQHGGRLVLAASGAVAACRFGLPDLASRLMSGETYRLNGLTDEERVAALQLRASWRGLELPDETGKYLIARVDRSTGALFALLDRLDQAALAAQKRLTVPFVRSVLEQS
jgi:DnaA family protein